MFGNLVMAFGTRWNWSRAKAASHSSHHLHHLPWLLLPWLLPPSPWPRI